MWSKGWHFCWIKSFLDVFLSVTPLQILFLLKECELYCIKSKKYLFPSSHPSWDVRMRIPSVRHLGMVEASSVRTCIHRWPRWCIPKSIQKTQFYLPTVLAATVSISIWILLWPRFKYSSWNMLNTHFYSVIPFTSFSQSLLSLCKTEELN